MAGLAVFRSFVMPAGRQLRLAGEQLVLAPPCLLGRISGGDLGVGVLGVGRPVPDGGADEPQRGTRVVSDRAVQPVVGQLRLVLRADLTARAASRMSGLLASAAGRRVGPGRNTVPGCSLMRRASSHEPACAEDGDMPGVSRHEGSQVLGHGTVSPHRIRAITGELRAMARTRASLYAVRAIFRPFSSSQSMNSASPMNVKLETLAV
ncbi:MAG: hypothetical protein ACLQDY_14945 [Streptosporangiaceae bacterium]